MAKIVEIKLTKPFSGIELKDIKITPSTLVIGLSPFILAISPLRDILKNFAFIYILYTIAKKFEETGKLI